jgi:ABC-type Mn2+/Zn2+ transport system permease subunit
MAFLFLPEKETNIALLGDISEISAIMVITTVIISVALFWTIKSIYAELILAGISPDLAQTTGANLKLNNTIYLICIAITVALGVRIVGGLMTAALLAIPACTAKNLCTSLKHYALTSTLAGSLACLMGIMIYAFFGIPAGPAIVIASIVLFLISVLKST